MQSEGELDVPSKDIGLLPIDACQVKLRTAVCMRLVHLLSAI